MPRDRLATLDERWREHEAISAAIALAEYFDSPDYRYGHAAALAAR